MTSPPKRGIIALVALLAEGVDRNSLEDMNTVVIEGKAVGLCRDI